MSTDHLTPDAQAILLLCGRFGRAGAASPLSPAEYDALAQWLQRRAMRPSDLLAGDWQDGATASDLPVGTARLQVLLECGSAMVGAVESWAQKGIWVVGRGDELYPCRLKTYLGRQSPPLFYGVGSTALLSGGGLAVVGSRQAGAAALAFAGRVAQRCAQQGIQVVSGGARGVDNAATVAALDEGGNVLVVLADSLARLAVAVRYREALCGGRLTFVTTYDPDSGFSIGNAMGRNKYIYALADHALVVTTAVEQGGTWAGAIEALKAGRTPVFAWVHGGAPEANHRLLERGALPFPPAPWADLGTLLTKSAAGPLR